MITEIIKFNKNFAYMTNFTKWVGSKDDKKRQNIEYMGEIKGLFEDEWKNGGNVKMLIWV